MFARLPLTALRTFESAARLASFRAAAMELNVTPTAVSHQIRGLEQWLGTLLFERLGRGVRLSEAGEKLQRSLHGALLEIDRSLNALKPPKRPSFARAVEEARPYRAFFPLGAPDRD